MSGMPTAISRRGPNLSTAQPSTGPISPDSRRATLNMTEMVVRFHPNSSPSGMMKLPNPWKLMPEAMDMAMPPAMMIHQP